MVCKYAVGRSADGGDGPLLLVAIALCLALLLMLAYGWYRRRDQGLLRLQESLPA
jgi:hypothetical protein